ncbi:MAG: tRNA (guanosine(46)-N7)-methyltransferase TrmB [Saprospiraceae bacterium]
MSKRNKLQKFAELLTFPNVYENFDSKQPQLTGPDGEIIDLKGKWANQHFQNEQPITLELACGRGEYSLGLARMYPERNFIGVDIKGARIWKGAGIALEEGLSNVAFLRTRIELITYFFAPAEISEIWITFPDPFLRKSKANRRLTSAHFLNLYRKLLRPGGIVHLKTDEPNLYEFTLETLAEDPHAHILYQDDDIYAKPLPFAELALKTYYESMHLAAEKTIKYIRFTIN